jgi:hypothetical protein
MVNFKPAENTLLKVASISAAALALFTAWSFYKNNLWSPNIIVKSVDYNKGIADLMINGKPFILKGDSTYLIGYDWGIKFGTTFVGNKRKYDRIEVTKRDKVHKILRNAEDTHS